MTTTTTRKNGKPSAQGPTRMASLSVSEALHSKALAEAKAKGISLSEFVRQALDCYFVAKDGE